MCCVYLVAKTHFLNDAIETKCGAFYGEKQKRSPECSGDLCAHIRDSYFNF